METTIHDPITATEVRERQAEWEKETSGALQRIFEPFVNEIHSAILRRAGLLIEKQS